MINGVTRLGDEIEAGNIVIRLIGWHEHNGRIYGSGKIQEEKYESS